MSRPVKSFTVRKPCARRCRPAVRSRGRGQLLTLPYPSLVGWPVYDRTPDTAAFRANGAGESSPLKKYRSRRMRYFKSGPWTAVHPVLLPFALRAQDARDGIAGTMADHRREGFAPADGHGLRGPAALQPRRRVGGLRIRQERRRQCVDHAVGPHRYDPGVAGELEPLPVARVVAGRGAHRREPLGEAGRGGAAGHVPAERGSRSRFRDSASRSGSAQYSARTVATSGTRHRSATGPTTRPSDLPALPLRPGDRRDHADDQPLRIGNPAKSTLQGVGYHREMWAMGAGGASNHDILRAATILGAEAIGFGNQLGSIERASSRISWC